MSPLCWKSTATRPAAGSAAVSASGARRLALGTRRNAGPGLGLCFGRQAMRAWRAQARASTIALRV
eukprot:5728230-Alexandrium_andersonii.AAC.1